MIFDRYIFRNLSIAMIFITATLAAILFLTQSLRFLELVINAGASAETFWFLTLLAVPRSLEIILPIASMAATLFVYNRMTMDSELTVMRATGFSPMSLARPALFLSFLTMLVLAFVTNWLTPMSMSNMEYVRNLVKAQYSTLFFREGVFSEVGDGLTVYIRDRGRDGELTGLIIHDIRRQNTNPVTIIARRGVLITTARGQQVVVFDGARQSLNPTTGVLDRLNFDRYTIDLPDTTNNARDHWREPEERSFSELIHPAAADAVDAAKRREFRAELNRRIATPLMAPALTFLSLALLLVGPVDRRGQTWRIIASVFAAILFEGLYMITFNAAHHRGVGPLAMYILTLMPCAACFYILHGGSESARAWMAGHIRRARAGSVRTGAAS